MSIPRLAVLSLLISGCMAPLAAQTSPDHVHATVSTNSFGRNYADQVQMPVSPLLRPESDNAETIQTAMGPVHRSLGGNSQDADSTSICYSMRSYRVVRDDPQSDSTKPAGYSTCQAAKRFQMKSIEDSPELIKR
jgi:hypothetical protein